MPRAYDNVNPGLVVKRSGVTKKKTNKPLTHTVAAR